MKSLLAWGLAALLAFQSTSLHEPPASLSAKTVVLSTIDVERIKKVATTEVVASLPDLEFRAQLRGVVDTILARVASGRWGGVERTLNAKWQFSMIASNLPGAWGAVDRMPANRINPRVGKEVDNWLRLRAGGTPSSIGDHLSYLNPYYSSRNSLDRWGRKVFEDAIRDGLLRGRGRAIHAHGTPPDLQKFRPGLFRVELASEE